MTRAAVASALLVTVISAGARAHDIDPDALIVRGLDLRRAGRSVEALELFQRAHREAPSPRTLGQMGLVETSLAHWIDAENHLAGALATLEDTWVRKNRPFLEQALGRAKDHLGELAITGRPGAKVSLAGKAIGVLPLAAPVRMVEGTVALDAIAADFKPFSVDVSIRGGARTAVTIVLEPVEVAPPTSATPLVLPASDPSRRSARRWTGLALAAVGVGALTWGIAWIELDNHDACRSAQAGGCGTVYDTKIPGWLLTAGGGVLALAGGAVFFSTLRPANVDLAFGITSRSLLFEGRF